MRKRTCYPLLGNNKSVVGPLISSISIFNKQTPDLFLRLHSNCVRLIIAAHDGLFSFFMLWFRLNQEFHCSEWCLGHSWWSEGGCTTCGPRQEAPVLESPLKSSANWSKRWSAGEEPWGTLQNNSQCLLLCVLPAAPMQPGRVSVKKLKVREWNVSVVSGMSKNFTEPEYTYLLRWFRCWGASISCTVTCFERCIFCSAGSAVLCNSLAHLENCGSVFSTPAVCRSPPVGSGFEDKVSVGLKVLSQPTLIVRETRSGSCSRISVLRQECVLCNKVRFPFTASWLIEAGSYWNVG